MLLFLAETLECPPSEPVVLPSESKSDLQGAEPQRVCQCRCSKAQGIKQWAGRCDKGHAMAEQ
eukprot:364594-Chlamydomonas_euryale.AAC.9